MTTNWRRGGWGWIDRILVLLVVVLQALILARLWTRPVADDARQPDEPSSEAAAATGDRMPGPLWPGPLRPVMTSGGAAPGFEAMVDRMNWMMADAVRDWEAMGRMMTRADPWPRLDPIPTLDMREDARAYTVCFTLPGVAVDDVRVMLDNRLLTVSIPHALPGAGRYRQVIRLPGPVGDIQSATAVLTNGVLRVSIPKGPPRAGAHPAGLRLF